MHLSSQSSLTLTIPLYKSTRTCIHLTKSSLSFSFKFIKALYFSISLFQPSRALYFSIFSIIPAEIFSHKGSVALCFYHLNHPFPLTTPLYKSTRTEIHLTKSSVSLSLKFIKALYFSIFSIFSHKGV